ncbi:MAG: hypothetical protein ABIV25_12825 [Paracoccaceae bacterium]
MANMGFKSWRCGATGPTTHEELREALIGLAKKKRGAKLLSQTFLDDNMFTGQDTGTLASSLTDKPATGATILVSSMEATAQKEVVNWIERVSDKAFNYSGGMWTVATHGNMTKSLKSYQFATVDQAMLAKMKPDDFVRKSGEWMIEFTKKPRIACRFGKDGTPLIYQMDY